MAVARVPVSSLRVTVKLVQYVLRDVIRGRWLAAYAVFFLLVTEALVRFGGDPVRALLSLSNVTLIVTPLVGIVFGAMYLYNAREFNELLLAQPIARRQLFIGLYLGLSIPVALAYLLGVGLPFVLRGAAGGAGSGALAALLACGVALTFVFTALAFLVAVSTSDKVRGLGTAIAIWLLATLLYDGLVLFVATTFYEYPLERPMLVLMLLNPVDLARVAMLLQFDTSAMMGYTGAVFRQFLGSTVGMVAAGTMLLAWILVPVAAAGRRFGRRDF